MPHEDWYWCWDWLVRPTLRAARLVVRPATTRRHRMEAGERCKWRIQCPRWFVRWWWRRRGGSVSGGGDDGEISRARSVTIWRLRNWRERDRQTETDRQTDKQTETETETERRRDRDAAQKQLQTRHADLLPAMTGALMMCMCVLRHFLMRLRTPVPAAYIVHASRGGAFVDLWRGCGLLVERRSRKVVRRSRNTSDGSVRVLRTMLARANLFVCVVRFVVEWFLVLCVRPIYDMSGRKSS